MKDQFNTSSTEEVDLGYLFRKIGDFFRSIVKQIFLVIAFFKKYIIITIILIVAGVGLGYFSDTYSPKINYENRVIVIPNFESVDYLYETVDELNAKIKYKDSAYLKGILANDYEYLKKVEIEPMPDIYNFIAQSEENIAVLRILFQNQDFTDFVEDIPTSKNYKYHKLVFTIEGKNSKVIIDKLFEDMNKNEHFLEYLEVFQENTRLQIQQNELMLAQADSIIKAGTQFAANGSDQSVIISDGRLDMILFRKQELLDLRLKLQKKMKDQVNVIKQVSANYNVINRGILSFSNKVKYPLLFLFVFSFFFFMRYLYRGLKSIAERS